MARMAIGPEDLVRASTEEVRGARFLLSPRVLPDVLAHPRFALLGLGHATAVRGAAGPWSPYGVTHFIGYTQAGDVVYGPWARTEAVLVVPADRLDAGRAAWLLDRAVYWEVEGEALYAVDAASGAREALGSFRARTGPGIFRDLEGGIDDRYPHVVFHGEPTFPVRVRFFRGSGDAQALTTGRLVRVPDPTPEAERVLTAERIEALVDTCKQVSLRVGMVTTVELSPTTALRIAANGDVHALAESPEAVFAPGARRRLVDAQWERFDLDRFRARDSEATAREKARGEGLGLRPAQAPDPDLHTLLEARLDALVGAGGDGAPEGPEPGVAPETKGG